LTATAEPPPEGGLSIFDVTLVPAEPPAELLYRHKPDLLRSAVQLLQRGEVIFTLTERDIRAQYKQAVLGIGWAVLNPLVSLVVLNLVFARVKAFNVGHVPYMVYLYLGLVAWGFFGGAIAGASNSLVSNKALMAKSHFPRECFPLSSVLGSAFTSLLAAIPLLLIFAIKGYAPRIESLWVPLYIAVEIPFTIGVALVVSSVIVQMRDLQQMIPIFLPLGMLATPVIWPFAKEISPSLRPVYSFFNPLGPAIDGIRGSVLLGHGPQWMLLGVALCGSLAYLVGGYALFKRLEVNFADLS
jgi:ABC-type polysaccharide/polyol phosphate export permease